MRAFDRRTPDFLFKYKSDWNFHRLDNEELEKDDPEVKKNLPTSVTGLVTGVDDKKLEKTDDSPIYRIINHYSSWYRMKRAVAWWMRILTYFKKNKTDEKNEKHLTVDEIQLAEQVLIHHVQRHNYSKIIQQLNQGKQIDKSNPLKPLCPFLDDKGLIRVGGRVSRTNIDGRHPYVIPHQDPVARSIIRETHAVAHVGVEWTISLVRRKFWITKARTLARKIIKDCVTCKKLFHKTCTQQMADLPLERVSADKPPFTFVGIDVFGPLYVKVLRSEVKRYGCLYTCFTTRAVHIEKLNSLDTESFLNCFRRFIARRGQPEKVFTDNGTNFVGAEAELKKCMKEMSKEEIKQYATKNSIKWHFNPPSASHMGGVWERMIRCTRRVLMGILPRQVRLTNEILETIFCEVESVINSRPLTKLTDDPSDLSPLTPNHLLILREGGNLPPGRFKAEDMYHRCWRHVQHMANQFWQKWIKTYLPELQRRVKWTEKKTNLTVGDLVLILDENTPRNLWPLALVKEVNVGRDGLVRSVKLKTRCNELVRPITKIVLLEAVA